jgi:hypothetical protein
VYWADHPSSLARMELTLHARGLPHHHRLMRMHVVSLQQTIGCGMTVHAARMREHFGRLSKNGAILVRLQSGHVVFWPAIEHVELHSVAAKLRAQLVVEV